MGLTLKYVMFLHCVWVYQPKEFGLRFVNCVLISLDLIRALIRLSVEYKFSSKICQISVKYNMKTDDRIQAFLIINTTFTYLSSIYLQQVNFFFKKVKIVIIRERQLT